MMEDAVRKQITGLASYRMIKFPKVIQNALLLIGYNLQDFNTPGTHLLNWKVIRNTLINEDFIDKILAYDYKGAKETPVPTYSYINRINTRLQSISNLFQIKNFRSG